MQEYGRKTTICQRKTPSSGKYESNLDLNSEIIYKTLFYHNNEDVTAINWSYKNVKQKFVAKNTQLQQYNIGYKGLDPKTINNGIRHRGGIAMSTNTRRNHGP